MTDSRVELEKARARWSAKGLLVNDEEAHQLACLKQEESNLARCYILLREDRSEWKQATADANKRFEQAEQDVRGLKQRVAELESQITEMNNECRHKDMSYTAYVTPIDGCPKGCEGVETDVLITCDDCNKTIFEIHEGHEGCKYGRLTKP